MNKILITGASGYLGSHITRRLVKKNDVYGLCRQIPENFSLLQLSKEKLIIGDLSDLKLYNIISKKNFDVIIHLVSLDHHESEKSAVNSMEINVIPTLKLLNCFYQRGLKKFIYFSTMQVLGHLESSIITTEFVPSPINKYGLTHLLSEQIVNYYNTITNIECINIRLSNGYGSPIFSENNCWWLVINDICKSAYEKNEINLLSDGSPLRDFIHVSDIAKAIELLVDNKNNASRNTYNLCSGRTVSILFIAHCVKTIYENKFNKEIKIVLPSGLVSDHYKPFDKIKNLVFDNSSLQKIGFKPKMSLEQGIEEMFDYLIEG